MAEQTGGRRAGVELKPEGYSIRLTIVDFLASFIPGLAWLAVMVALAHPHKSETLLSQVGAPFGATGSAAFIPAAVMAIILGYGIKPLATTLASYATLDAMFARVANRYNKRKLKEQLDLEPPVVQSNASTGERGNPTSATPDTASTEKRNWRWWGKRWLEYLQSRSFAFPYEHAYRTKDYYPGLVEAVSEHLGLDECMWRSLPRHPPFSVCKRIVQVLQPTLWEELEHREAETRMLASLTVAALASAAAAVRWEHGTGLLIALGAYLFLGVSFRRARRREVDYVYLNFLIAHATNQKSNVQLSCTSSAP